MAENIPDKPKHLGSFTNRPELEGQIDPDTGEPWIYTPKENYWRDYEKDPVTHPEITMGEGRAIIETPTSGYAGTTEALPKVSALMGRTTRPPEGARGPDYTDRSGFEQQVFKQLGGNPFTIDVMAEVNKSYTQSFPEIYNRFFRGEVTWADQGKMNKDQIEEANVLRNRYRAYLHDRITSTLKAKQNDYTMMMQRFDHEAAVVKVSRERLIKEQKELAKAPTLKPMLNEKGKWTYHQWADGRWVDTGKGAKAPKAPISAAEKKRLEITEERFRIQTSQTVAAARTAIISEKDNKEIFDANQLTFNTTNTRNEVTYWDTSKWDNEAKFIKLPPAMIKDGWTPSQIQAIADETGMTVEQFLNTPEIAKYFKPESKSIIRRKIEQ